MLVVVKADLSPQGAAGRLEGVSPVAVSILMHHLKSEGLRDSGRDVGAQLLT